MYNDSDAKAKGKERFGIFDIFDKTETGYGESLTVTNQKYLQERANQIKSFSRPKTFTASLDRGDDCLDEVKDILQEIGDKFWLAFKDEHKKLDQILKVLRILMGEVEVEVVQILQIGGKSYGKQ